MCRWVSTKPGITIDFEASITSALGALMFARTAEILPPSTSTSACSKSPTALSRLSTQPPLIRIGRPGAGAAAGCCALAVPTTLKAVEAAAVAALVQRNCRRDSADGLHALQKQDVMASSRMSVIMRGCYLRSGAASSATTSGGDDSVGRRPLGRSCLEIYCGLMPASWRILP